MTKRIAAVAFTLTLKDGGKRQYSAGEQVDAEHVEHWFVKAHSTVLDPAAEAAGRAEQEARADELQRLTEENALLRKANKDGAAEMQRLQDEHAKLHAQCDDLKAELAAGTPPAADTKDGGKGKGDKGASGK